MTSADVLDGIEKLNDGNYLDWAWGMEALLTRKELWDVVSGDETKPIGSLGSKVVKAFVKKQKMARAEIILHVSTSQRPHTRFDDPKEIWENLKKIHQPPGLNSRFALLRQFFALVKDTDQSMLERIGQVKDLVGHLVDEKHGFNDEFIILKMTSGLPESFDSFRVALDLVPEDQLTLDYVTNHLLAESIRQESDTPYSSQVAMAAQHKAKSNTVFRNVTCHYCQRKGHYERDCRQKKKDEEEEEDTGPGNTKVPNTSETAGLAMVPLLT